MVQGEAFEFEHEALLIHLDAVIEIALHLCYDGNVSANLSGH
jgi:hypothetical protein